MNILFVCSGNTCRSPLAEAIMRRELRARELEGITVASAGTGALEGTPASEGSYLVGLENGLDLSGHLAQPLTESLVREADLILVMAGHHLSRVLSLGGEGKSHLLGDWAGGGPDTEVADPFGADLEEYRATYRELALLVERAVDRLSQDHGVK